jgi:hypothetical protein
MRTIVRDINWGRRFRNYSIIGIVLGMLWVGLSSIWG